MRTRTQTQHTHAHAHPQLIPPPQKGREGSALLLPYAHARTLTRTCAQNPQQINAHTHLQLIPPRLREEKKARCSYSMCTHGHEHEHDHTRTHTRSRSDKPQHTHTHAHLQLMPPRLKGREGSALLRQLRTHAHTLSLVQTPTHTRARTPPAHSSSPEGRK